MQRQSPSSLSTGDEQEQPLHLQRFLRLADVRAYTGLSVSTLYEMMGIGAFPRPIHISKRSVAWPESEVIVWQQARLAAAKAALEPPKGKK